MVINLTYGIAVTWHILEIVLHMDQIDFHRHAHKGHNLCSMITPDGDWMLISKSCRIMSLWMLSDCTAYGLHWPIYNSPCLLRTSSLPDRIVDMINQYGWVLVLKCCTKGHHLQNTQAVARSPSHYKILFYQYRDPHVKDKTVSRPSYL